MMREDPFVRFAAWMALAEADELNDPNAMTLATIGLDGMPQARIVLLKDVSQGGFVFYTNTKSDKGEQLARNPNVGLLFHWKSLRRQVRIGGTAVAVPGAEADAYYATRPRVSRLGAWASDQSRPLDSRVTLDARVADAGARFPDEAIPRPPHWAGYRVTPARFEFWQDMPFRLHEREVFVRAGGDWATSLLYP